MHLYPPEAIARTIAADRNRHATTREHHRAQRSTQRPRRPSRHWLWPLLILGPLAAIAACGERTVEPCEEPCIPIPRASDTLATEIDLPDGNGPHPVLISVHGSGRVERHQFAQTASFWNSQGVAYVRYDKRGVGQSTGRYRDVNAGNSAEVFDTLARDVVAVVDYVAALPEIDADRIGLIGSSQAGWIMPLAADRSEEVDFIISISGAASSVGISDHYDRIAEDGFTDIEITRALAEYDGTIGFDPAPILGGLDIPILWIYGGRDHSNPTRHDIAVIETIRDTHGSEFTVHLFPNGDHQLIDADSGEPFDTFLPMTQWLRERGVLPA